MIKIPNTQATNPHDIQFLKQRNTQKEVANIGLGIKQTNAFGDYAFDWLFCRYSRHGPQ